MSQYEPDFEFDGLIVEVKHHMRAIRSLRTTILNLASLLVEDSDTDGCLLLIDPGISANGLEQEWELLNAVLRPGFSERLSIASCREGQLDRILGRVPQHHLKRLREIASQEAASAAGAIRLPKPDYQGEILRLMILLWLQTASHPSGPIESDPLPYADDKPPARDAKGFTVSYLEEASGASYRTVIRALDSVGPALTRFSDRSVELTAFPRQAWEKLLVLLDEYRSTRYLADRSGQPRSPASLIKRLRTQNRPDIAIGGVTGAMRIHPELDIVASPRLDVHVHAPGLKTNLSFVKRLDPALQEVRPGEEKPSLAIHFLRRKRSFFKVDSESRLWADPVECLLDLLSMRMDYQALQFRNAIVPKDASKWPT